MAAETTHPLGRFDPVLLVGIGGFVGAIARYSVDLALPGTFPWGTLAANVTGSFALGVLLYEARFSGLLAPETRLAIGTGFISSFTTYSTFAAQTANLTPKLAAANVAANYVLGVLAVLLGRHVVREVVG